MVASASLYAVAAVSVWAATPALTALVSCNQLRYGTCAVWYCSALAPSHTPARTEPSVVVSSFAAEEYSVLNERQASAAANSEPGPGPLLSKAECTSGGAAIHTGAVMIGCPPHPLNRLWGNQFR
ncbi:Uncharacterised protein [Mycobacteroides abscessus subsp. massiliense]|nr:Uncharacterised protein [Mycobacteroides abscessus subsp. massiliense]